MSVFIKSEEIKDFQNKLQRLAEDIMQLHDTLTYQLNTLHEDWDDPKYEEFVSDFEQEKHRIVEISETFHEVVTGDLQQRYEKAVTIENVRG